MKVSGYLSSPVSRGDVNLATVAVAASYRWPGLVFIFRAGVLSLSFSTTRSAA